MQDINKKEIEREQSQTREICFEVRAHLLYVPAFNTMKDFHYKPIPPDHSVSQHLQGEFTLELLGLSSPFTCSRKNTPQAHKLAEAAPQTKSSHANSKHREPASLPTQIQRWNFGDHNTLIT